MAQALAIDDAYRLLMRPTSISSATPPPSHSRNDDRDGKQRRAREGASQKSSGRFRLP